jgi:hypothetical protein
MNDGGSMARRTLGSWLLVSLLSAGVALAVWQENVRPKMYVQLGESSLTPTPPSLIIIKVLVLPAYYFV